MQECWHLPASSAQSSLAKSAIAAPHRPRSTDHHFWVYSLQRNDRSTLEPLLALVRNSLLVYFGSHVLVAVLRRLPGYLTSRA